MLNASLMQNYTAKRDHVQVNDKDQVQPNEKDQAQTDDKDQVIDDPTDNDTNAKKRKREKGIIVKRKKKSLCRTLSFIH